MNITYNEILPGIRLRHIESDRFQTSCVSVSFLSRIDEETASAMTLVPRVLRRGTEPHPDMEALAAALDELYGARIEPLSRKFGDMIASGVICDFVDVGGNVFAELVDLLKEVLLMPLLKDGSFCEDFVEGERANLIDEIKSEINSKLSYAHRRAVSHMFKGSAFSVSELGTEQSAEKLEARTLTNVYKKMISSMPCEIFFCGKRSFEDVAGELCRVFEDIQRKPQEKLVCGVPAVSEKSRVCERLDIAQANLLIGLKTDSEDIYMSKLLANVIGGGTNSKLFVNVREKESLCYFAGTMFDSFSNAMFMYCGIDPKKAEVAEAALIKELENCKNGDISDEEIAAAKKHMIDGLITTEDSLSSMESFWLRAALIRDERTPREVAFEIKNIDGEKLSEAARGFNLSLTYLLTGMEGNGSERKLLCNA